MAGWKVRGFLLHAFCNRGASFARVVPTIGTSGGFFIEKFSDFPNASIPVLATVGHPLKALLRLMN